MSVTLGNRVLAGRVCGAAFGVLLLARCGPDAPTAMDDPVACLTGEDAVVTSEQREGANTTVVQVRLPSGAILELTLPDSDSNVVQVTKWVTPDPSSLDEELVDGCVGH